MMGLPGEARASCNGHGTLDILEVTQILEKAGIPCCIVGKSALKYFGAWIMRNDWEICVPTESLNKAFSILQAPPYNEIYELWQHDRVQPWSLLHTFPRLKKKGVNLWFDLIPSDDCHILCEPSNFERSKMGLPYPKLDIFAQSLVDTHDRVHITDLIDGMGLTEEWGSQHLDLSGTNDVAWAEEKNKRIRASVPETPGSLLLELSEAPFSKKEIWDDLVRSKDRRIDLACPEGVYVTRFRTRESGDPRLLDRDFA
ncbi:hypothetical protein N431DRAFT_498990 [Stipitochalara longipes BDJ]|nr:hypothetical protein N431DRAFT_498990 [Stipitochalara longipes BDJ]